VHHHEPDQTAVHVVALRQPHRQRRQERHARRPERPGHGRHRRDREHDPGDERTPSPDDPSRPVDDPFDGAVGGRDPEEVGDAGEQDQEPNRQAAHELGSGFARVDGPDQERHRERQDAEVDGSRGADQEDHHQPEDARDVDGQGQVRPGWP
jgi:hypothetical protein